MGFFDRLRGLFTKGVADSLHAKAEIVTVSEERTNPLSASAELAKELDPAIVTQAYMQSPLVRGAVDRLSRAVMAVPIKVYRKKPAGVVEVQEGPTYNLLDWINSEDTFAETIRDTVAWLSMHNNAYWLVEPSPSEYRQQSPLQITVLDADKIRPVLDNAGLIVRWVYTVRGNSTDLDARRVIHFKGFSPVDRWRGSSPITALQYDIEIERYAKRRMSTYFTAATVVSGVVEFGSDLGDDELLKLKKDLNAQYAGPKNVYKLMLLTGGGKYTPVKESQEFMSIVPVLEQNAEMHAMVLGVPLALLTLSSSNEKMIEHEAAMWKHTLLPMLKSIEQMITKRLARIESKQLYCAFDTTRIEALELQVLNQVRADVAELLAGAVTPNEVRIRRGRPTYVAENAEFGDTPRPVWDANQASKMAQQEAQNAQASPSLDLPGSQGGRDQSKNGEAQMVDPTARKAVESAFLNAFLIQG